MGDELIAVLLSEGMLRDVCLMPLLPRDDRRLSGSLMAWPASSHDHARSCHASSCSHVMGIASRAFICITNGRKSKGARRTGPLRASVNRHYFFFFAAFLVAFLAPFFAAFFVAFFAAFLAMVKWV